jgi:hypothetical protein
LSIPFHARYEQARRVVLKWEKREGGERTVLGNDVKL